MSICTGARILPVAQGLGRPGRRLLPAGYRPADTDCITCPS